MNFEEFYDANLIKSVIKRIVNLSKNKTSFVNDQYLMIDVIYDYYTIIDNEDESINIFDSVDDQYIQGFRIKIEPSDKMKLDSFIESSYDVIMYIYKKFLEYDNFVVLNYAVLVSLRASSEFNTHLYLRLNEADFQTKSSINLNRIRNNKSLLTIPIKDKYNINQDFIISVGQ